LYIRIEVYSWKLYFPTIYEYMLQKPIIVYYTRPLVYGFDLGCIHTHTRYYLNGGPTANMVF